MTVNPFALSLALWRLQLDVWTLAATAPLVMAHRLAKAGTGWHEPGFVADPEWQRMVSEKVEAALEAHGHAARWWLGAIHRPPNLQRDLAATRRALRPYARRVAGNARRLGR